MGAGDQGTQSKPLPTPPLSLLKQLTPPSPQQQQIPHPPPSPKTAYQASSSTPSSTDKLLMEYIASSQQQIKLLTEERELLKGNVAELTDKVHSLAAVYDPIPSWSEVVSDKVKTVAAAELDHYRLLETQAKALSDLAVSTRISLHTHDEALTTLTDQQSEMASSMVEYITHTHKIIAGIPTMVDHQLKSTDEITALRTDLNSLTQSVQELVTAFNDNIKGENADDDDDDVTRNVDHNKIILMAIF